MLQSRTWVSEVLEVGWMRPVLEIAEVCDEGWIIEILLGSEVIEVERRGQRLYELRVVSFVLWIYLEFGNKPRVQSQTL